MRHIPLLDRYPLRHRTSNFVAAITAALLLCYYGDLRAETSQFHAGSLIPQFGRIADVTSAPKLLENQEFHVRFDIADGAPSGDLNRQLVTVARFLNLHTANGVPPERLHAAIVIHGSATVDALNQDSYKRRQQTANANAPLIEELLRHGVQIWVCGQSAAAHHITEPQLHSGIKMALSAMTAHALLAQAGYSLNPF